MCGIAGIVSKDPAKRARIREMLDAIRHRGPDDEGIHATEDLALGQRRLSIIDLGGGHQPMPNHDKTIWIVFNGEIYNYVALKAELSAQGFQFRTQSDTEVILNLYERDGARCLTKLRGMFSFAIWDERSRRLFCARDHLGQKPFYYVQRGNELMFASEIKALVAADPNLRRPNVRALDQYLSLRVVSPPDSMFEDIRKLPPACSLTFSESGGLEIAQYWDLDYEPKWKYNENDLVDALEEKLTEALRLHMVSDVPVGAFMSGGLDSTLLVAMLMKHVATEPLKTFTFGLPYRQYDESAYARMVAEAYGTDHHEHIVTPSLVENLDQLVWFLDEPSDPLSVCLFLLSGFAAKHVKVVIGGDGGDELFGGYDRYYGNVYTDYYAAIPEPIRRYVIGPVLDRVPDGRWYKSKAHQIKWMHKLSFQRGGDRYANALGYFYFQRELREQLYGPRMRDVELHPEQWITELFARAKVSHPVDRMLYTDSFSRLPDHPVMLSDRMTMAHSLESRAPFMDHVLAEFVARIPANMKVAGRSLRYVQRRLAARYLPEEVLRRPKQGFSSALPYMLRDEFTLLFNAFLRRSELAADGFIRQDAVNKLLEEHLSGRRDHGNRLWLLCSSETWYRVHIQGLARSDLRQMVRASEHRLSA